MKFNTWNTLNEAFSEGKISDAAENIRKQLEEETGKKLFLIPDFDTFTRDNEPLQKGYLISSEELNTMRLNFTENGKLYSIDIWKPEGKKPEVTVYLNNLPLDQALVKVSTLYKNPTKAAITEEEAELVVTAPAPQQEGDKKVKKVEIEAEYEYADPDVVFDDLVTYIKMVINGEMNSLLLTGQAGVGKTFLVTRTLQDSGMKRNEDYFKVTGKTTAAGMFMTLYEYNGKIILFDDCDSVFRDDNAVNVLKGALDTAKVREISWNSAVPLKTADKRQVPKKFDFTGKVIFISNLARKKIDPAIRSRAFMLEIALTKDDMISRMWSLLPKVEIPSGAQVSGVMKDKAMNLLTQAADETEDVELSLRTLLKAIAIVNNVPTEQIAKRMIKQQCSK
jgi:hypothetical protein